MTDTSNYMQQPLFMPQYMQPQQPIAPQTQGNLQPQDLQHVNDVMNQYIQSKQSQQNGGLLQQILSNRMQPADRDISRSIVDTASSFGAPQFQPITPEGAMANRITNQLSPYSDALKRAQQGETLSGTQMENQIKAQTGLPMAMADLQTKQLALKIQQETGLPLAEAQVKAAQIANQYAPALNQARIGLEGAQAGSLNNEVARKIEEMKFQYANDPQMAQAAAMAAFMRSFGNGGSQPTPQQNGFGGMSTPATPTQPNGGQIPPSDPITQQQGHAASPQGSGFNPMGAMFGKSLGLTDMQVVPDGQGGARTMQIPGTIIKGANGEILTVDQNGNVTQGIPRNPKAQQQFDSNLQDIMDNINKLKDMGEIVDEDAGWTENKQRQFLATGVGQSLSQGTQAQSLRDEIIAKVKQSVPIYMQAMGITPGMERAQQAQQMLLDAIGANLGKSYQFQANNLQGLSGQAGAGTLKTGLKTKVSNPIANATIPQGAIDMLRQNPSLAPQFEQKYGVPAKDYLQ